MSLDDTKLTVGQRIARLCGETLRVRLAEQLGIDRKTIKRWEDDEALPDGRSLLLLWRHLGARPDWVLLGDGERPALEPMEIRLLASFRGASTDVQEAVLRALETGKPLKGGSKVKQTFMQDVHQVVTGDGASYNVSIHSEQAPYKVQPEHPKSGPKKP